MCWEGMRPIEGVGARREIEGMDCGYFRPSEAFAFLALLRTMNYTVTATGYKTCAYGRGPESEEITITIKVKRGDIAQVFELNLLSWNILNAFGFGDKEIKLSD